MAQPKDLPAWRTEAAWLESGHLANKPLSDPKRQSLLTDPLRTGEEENLRQLPMADCLSYLTAKASKPGQGV